MSTGVGRGNRCWLARFRQQRLSSYEIGHHGHGKGVSAVPGLVDEAPRDERGEQLRYVDRGKPLFERRLKVIAI